jgi:hypothetical protein
MEINQENKSYMNRESEFLIVTFRKKNMISLDQACAMV